MRAHCITGFFWAILIPGLNQFFYFRFPNVSISGVCLLCYAAFYTSDADSTTADRVTLIFPYRLRMGAMDAPRENIRRCTQSRSIHC